MQSTQTASNLTQDTFLEYFDEYQAASEAVAEAVANRRDVMKRAEGAGINKRGFLSARKLAEMSGDRRQQEFDATQTYMGYLGKPLTPDGAPATTDGTITDQQRRKVHGDGYDAGRHGHPRQALNTWAPGSLLYQVFDSAWLEGHEALEHARKDNPSDNPKRRGRPRGSANRPGNGAGTG